MQTSDFHKNRKLLVKKKSNFPFILEIALIAFQTRIVIKFVHGGGNTMLNEQNIFLNLNLNNKQDVLEFISNKAHELNICKNISGVLEDLNHRELEYSTGLQDGFAIPHAKSEHVKEATILFLRLNTSIEWGTMDDSKVSYIFALLVPKENEGNVHLQMISKLAVCLLEDDFKEFIKSCNDSTELKEYITKNMEVA